MPGKGKLGVKRAYGWALTRVSTRRRRDCQPSKSVVILGTGRSGTTLLLQLIASSPRTLPVYEPFRPSEDPAVSRHSPPSGGFVEGPPDDAMARQIADLWSEILSGRRLTWWSASQASPRQVWSADAVAVKEIRVNRMATWIVEEFPDLRVVAIVRHPCAVVASMRSSPGIWNEWTYEQIVGPIRRAHPDRDIDRILDGSGRSGWLAAFWATDTLALLHAAACPRLHVLAYEHLITRPALVVRELEAHLGVELPGAWSRLKEPSATANPGAAIHTGGDLLGGWCSRLTNEEIDEILRVTHAMGLVHYDRRPDLQLPLLPRNGDL